MKFLFQLILFCLISLSVLGQGNTVNERRVVLAKEMTGKVYVFDHSEKEHHDRTELIYLGKIKTSKARIIKVLTYRWYWGLTPRTTSRILIYDNQDRYLGNYYVDMTTWLPAKIENDALVFTKTEDCDEEKTVNISFKNGIPKEFYTQCGYFKFSPD